MKTSESFGHRRAILRSSRFSLSLATTLCATLAGAAGTADSPAADQSPPAPQAALAVEVFPVHVVPSSREIALTGEIEARDTLRAAFTTSGRVASVLVAEGDRVKKGDELARIEQVQQEQNLRAAEAGMLTAQADLKQAQDDFSRKEALLERGATTRTLRDSAEDTLRQTEAAVAQAQAEVDLARKSLSDTVLLAPADAIVTARSAEAGQVVSAAQTVIELALGGDYDAVFQVPESMLTVPRDAPAVDLELIDVTAAPFAGQVREISPIVNPQLGTVQVKVGVVDPPPGIGFGASVRGSIRREEDPNVALPFQTLTATAQGPAVWVVDPAEETVSLRTVQVLRHESGQVFISGGLTEGDMVVGRGSQLLFPGRKVRAVTIAGATRSVGD